ncbi:MarR family transcriptional regulator [bacterium]|nr:MarR family transcriptional regulator [bacterium]
MPFSDPRAEVLNDLFDGFRGMRELFHGLIALYGLNISHYAALKHLHRQGPRSMSQLTSFLNVTHGASTSVIDRLAAIGLAERQAAPHDRRVVQVQITLQGQEVLKAIADESILRLTTVFADLSNDDRQQLAQGLKILANSIRTAHASPLGENHANR